VFADAKGRMVKRHLKEPVMKFNTAVMALFLMTLTVCGGQAEIYSWTDENGVKHYSHIPPTEKSIPVKTAPEIKSDPSAYAIQEVINETNIEAVIKQLDQSDPASPPKAAPPKKPPSGKERIAAEAEKLLEKIAWLEQLPPEAYANTRSKQAIIGRYRYRLTQLQSDPDAYFKEFGR
jgi:hypothetical protein